MFSANSAMMNFCLANDVLIRTPIRTHSVYESRLKLSTEPPLHAAMRGVTIPPLLDRSAVRLRRDKARLHWLAPIGPMRRASVVELSRAACSGSAWGCDARIPAVTVLCDSQHRADETARSAVLVFVFTHRGCRHPCGVVRPFSTQGDAP